MSLGRRHVTVDDHRRWVFNGMEDAYEARPPYPLQLVEALEALADGAGGGGARVCDIGAGIGHLAIPLAGRGHAVTAVEPAQFMLRRLVHRASAAGCRVEAVHAAAEALPLAPASAELVVVADALHFIDVRRAAYQVARVLAQPGALAVVTCRFAPTPFMQRVARVIDRFAERRVRDVTANVRQLQAVAGVRGSTEQRIRDCTRVDRAALEGILRSISFVGPAMSDSRFAEVVDQILSGDAEPLWEREFTVHGGRRRGHRR